MTLQDKLLYSNVLKTVPYAISKPSWLLMSLSSIAKHIRQSMRGFTVKNSPNPVLMLKPPHHQPLYEEKENVYPTYKPLSLDSKTKPHLEIRIEGYNYSCGVWQFEGHGFVLNGTFGVCIMQVFEAHPKHDTTLMLDVYNNSIVCHNNSALVPNIRDTCFQSNVIHDVEASSVNIYVDGVQGGSSDFFKFGVYTQDDPSIYMESRWKGNRVLRKFS
ncbi:Citrate-binding protein [Glycine max]|nr:Citrate-binding protein [Glycine max]